MLFCPSTFSSIFSAISMIFLRVQHWVIGKPLWLHKHFWQNTYSNRTRGGNSTLCHPMATGLGKNCILHLRIMESWLKIVYYFQSRVDYSLNGEPLIPERRKAKFMEKRPTLVWRLVVPWTSAGALSWVRLGAYGTLRPPAVRACSSVRLQERL